MLCTLLGCAQLRLAACKPALVNKSIPPCGPPPRQGDYDEERCRRIGNEHVRLLLWHAMHAVHAGNALYARNAASASAMRTCVLCLQVVEALRELRKLEDARLRLTKYRECCTAPTNQPA